MSSKFIKKVGVFIGVAGIVSMGAIGISKVSATNNEPKMTIKAEGKTIETFEDKSFDIVIKLNPGTITYDANKPTGMNLDGTEISIDNSAFKIITVMGKTKNESDEDIAFKDIKVTEDIITLGKINYLPKALSGGGYVFKGKEIELTITLKALTQGEYKGNKSLDKSIYLNHKNINNEFVSGGTLNCNEKEISIIVDKFKYNEPKLVAGDFLPKHNKLENGNKAVRFGELLELNYRLIPPEIMTTGNEVDNSERKIIYVLDEDSLNKKEENGKIGKDTLINSLNQIKKVNPKQEIALITYGNSSKVIKSSNKAFCSIDEIIKNIKSMEPREKNGNLGDALRKTQFIINNNKNSNITVFLITAGDPAYFTTGENEERLLEFSEKNGELETGFEGGKEYAEEIATLITEENKKNNRNVTWFNVNYSLDENQKFSNEIIKILKGETLNDMKTQPSFAFKTIVKNVTSDLVIEGEIKVEGSKDVKVAPESNKKLIIHYEYKKDSNGNVMLNDKKQKTLVPIMKDEDGNGVEYIPIKVGVKFLSAEVIDLADPQSLKVSYVPKVENPKEITFNTNLNVGEEIAQWKVEPTINYLKLSGLHNGKLNNFSTTRDGVFTVESMEFMQTIGSQIFDAVNASELNMSRENTFRTGTLLRVGSPSAISLNIEKINGNINFAEKDITWKVYEYNHHKKSFENPVSKAYKDVKVLESEKLYLIVTDCFIPNSAEVNSTFNIGYKVNLVVGRTNQNIKGDDPVLNGGVTVQEAEPATDGVEVPVIEGVIQYEEDLYDKYFLNEKEKIGEEKASKETEITIETKIVVKDKPEHY